MSTLSPHRRTRRPTLLAAVGFAFVLLAGTHIFSAPPASADQNEQPGSAVQPSISVGYEHSCAIVGNSGVRCWGSNNVGQLGLGNTDTVGDYESPNFNVTIGTPATAVSAGNSFSCALLAGGNVRCWGLNDKGQLGIGNTINIGDDENPTANVNLGVTATAITSGRNHSCALLSGGNVRCWGNNFFGQLGIADTTNIGDNENPTTNVNLGGAQATSITAGNAHTCALLSTGNVRCWGNNSFGQLGIANTTNIGDNESPTTNVNLGGKTVFAIAAGEDHTCALLYPNLIVAPGYDVRCWGYNEYGQLGIGTTVSIGDNESPTVNVNLSGNAGFGFEAVALSAGGDTSCVRFQNGKVRCWGHNLYLQLGIAGGNVGDNVGENPTTNVSLGSENFASALTTGTNNSCAVLTTGEVTCWGLNGVGQLGAASTVSPSLSLGTIADLNIGPDTINPSVRLLRLGTGPYSAAPVRFNGIATDTSGIASVSVAIYRSIGSGQYWNGTGWQTSYVSVPATLLRTDRSPATPTTSAAATINWQYFFNGPPGGLFGIALISYDVAGNLTVSSGSFEIADTISPTVTVANPTAGQALGSRPVSITGTATDNAGISGVQVVIYRPIGTGQYWNGATWQASYATNTAALNAAGSTSTNWTYSFNPPQSGGSYYVSAIALDTSLQYASTPFTSFTLPDSTAPNATISPPSGTTSSGPFVISGTVTDNSSIYATYVAIYRVSTAQFWNGVSWQATFTSVPANTATPGTNSSTYTYSFTPPANGTYFIGVLPVDSNYNYRFVGWNTINVT
jgi:alpha-tubulin suppressor-like RCC1 family protein